MKHQLLRREKEPSQLYHLNKLQNHHLNRHLRPLLNSALSQKNLWLKRYNSQRVTLKRSKHLLRVSKCLRLSLWLLRRVKRCPSPNRRRDSSRSTLEDFLGLCLRQMSSHCSLLVEISLKLDFWKSKTVSPRELVLLSSQQSLPEPKHSISTRANREAGPLKLRGALASLTLPRINLTTIMLEAVAILTKSLSLMSSIRALSSLEICLTTLPQTLSANFSVIVAKSRTPVLLWTRKLERLEALAMWNSMILRVWEKPLVRKEENLMDAWSI